MGVNCHKMRETRIWLPCLSYWFSVIYEEICLLKLISTPPHSTNRIVELTTLLASSCRLRYKSLIFNQYKHSPNNKSGKFRREKMRRFLGVCTFLRTFILRLDSTKSDKMRCWNLWKAKSGLRSTFGIPPNTHPPHKRGILAFYRYIIKISTKCVWFCVRLSNTSRAYKNDDKELRPQKTEELIQIYTFCASIPTTERRKWLPETEFFMFTEDMPLHAQNNL